jgi:hypothetical protein
MSLGSWRNIPIQFHAPRYSFPKSSSSLKRLTLFCFLCVQSTLSCDELVSWVMKLSIRFSVSGRFTVNPPSRLPPMTSKPEDVDVGDVGDVEGDVVVDDEGEMDIAILTFVAMVRRLGISAEIILQSRKSMMYGDCEQDVYVLEYDEKREYEQREEEHTTLLNPGSVTTHTVVPIQYTPAVAPNNERPMHKRPEHCGTHGQPCASVQIAR